MSARWVRSCFCGGDMVEVCEVQVAMCESCLFEVTEAELFMLSELMLRADYDAHRRRQQQDSYDPLGLLPAHYRKQGD